jgi:hypothetical protein
MSTLGNLTIGQLKRAIIIRERLESLQGELSEILGGETPIPHAVKGTRKMSAAGRARIAAAQRARWAKAKGNGASVKPKRKMSAAARAAISAAAKARWKQAKAAGKTRL